MASLLDTMAPAARVAVIRLRSLGDCVLTTPALELLQQHRPDLDIAVVVEDRFREIFAHHPAVSSILPPTLAGVRHFRPDLVINLHGGTRSALLTVGSGARLRAGFGHFVGTQAYNIRIPRAQEILVSERPVHTAEHLASAMFYLGVPQREIPRASLYASGKLNPQKGPYAVIHPFASAVGKSWPPAQFATVARQLGMPVVVLAGPADHTAPFAEFTTCRNASLDTVKLLLRDASLFIGNDSGPAHMAAAFNIPCIVLFGPTNPATWGPWRAPAKVLHSESGWSAISVDDCFKAVDELKVRAHE